MVREVFEVTPTLLVVEDDVQFVTLLWAALADAYTLQHVSTLQAALEAVGQQLYAGILLDLHLPDSDRLSTLTTMLRAVRYTPIVVLTGGAVPARQVSGCIILHKPDIDWLTFPKLLRDFFEAPYAWR